MTDTRSFVRGLGATAAVLGALAFVVGAPTRPQRTGRHTVVSAATRDAIDGCARNDTPSSRVSGVSADPSTTLGMTASADPSTALGLTADASSRASEASRGIVASWPRGICTTVSQPISALQLAQWIRDGRPGLRVLDLRDSSAFELRHIPSAEPFALMELSSVLPKQGETVVLYSDDDVRDAQGIAWLAAVGHARVHVVRGGMRAWMTEVIDPVVQGDSAAAVAALSRYFGGVPRSMAPSKEARATPKVRARNATDEFGVVARRGC
jgi:rhodanese-related sulfurtransferase